jgi:hypothetical protein
MDGNEVYQALLLRKELLGLPHLAHLNALAEGNLQELNLKAKDEAEKMAEARKKREQDEVNRIAKEKFDLEAAEKRAAAVRPEGQPAQRYGDVPTPGPGGIQPRAIPSNEVKPNG